MSPLLRRAPLPDLQRERRKLGRIASKRRLTTTERALRALVLAEIRRRERKRSERGPVLPGSGDVRKED